MQCDGLAVVSFAHPLINAAIAQIREAGVPVIAMLSDIHEAADEPYVGQDNHEVGRTMGWLMAHTCGARKGSVGVLLGGHRFLGHQARVEGLRSYLAERAPGLRLLEAVINLDNCDITEEATLDLLARHDDLRGLCVVGGGGDGVINALSQLPKQPSLCCILQESTELSRQALDQGLISLVIDSQPRLLATALVDLLVELQTTPDFDPIRHRIHIPLQIITSEKRPSVIVLRGWVPNEKASALSPNRFILLYNPPRETFSCLAARRMLPRVSLRAAMIAFISWVPRSRAARGSGTLPGTGGRSFLLDFKR